MTFDLSMPPQKFLSYVADWEKQQSKRHHFKKIDSIERTVVWILWRVALERLLLGTFLLRCECQILLRSPVVLQWMLLSHSLRDQPARISSCFVHEGLTGFFWCPHMKARDWALFSLPVRTVHHTTETHLCLGLSLIARSRLCLETPSHLAGGFQHLGLEGIQTSNLQ